MTDMTGAGKKVIIVYSTAGLGHKKAALAVKEAFELSAPECDVEIVDVMEYATPLYKFAYLDFYVFAMKKATWLWAFIYYASNSPLFDKITRRLRGRLDHKGLPGFADFLRSRKADAIVATHFLVTSIARILKEEEGISSSIFAIMTDYGPHTYWLSDSVDSFFVGCASAKTELAKRGVPDSRIIDSGIPAMDEFTRDLDKDALREKYGVDKNKKTVFIMSGGFGVGPVARILEDIGKCRTDLQVIAVCGHNTYLYDELEKLSAKLNYAIRLFGFTDKVAELMAVSDIMVTKAGGISVTEAMDSRLPMILYGSIPGQETWNERFLVSSGAAKKAEVTGDIPGLIDGMFGSKEVYASLKKNIDLIRKPNAARDVVKKVLEAPGD